MPDRPRPNVFAGAYLDRRSAERATADWLELAYADSDTVYVISRSTMHLVYPGEQGRVAYLRRDDPLVAAASPNEFVLLGWLNGRRHVLVDLAPSSEGRVPEGASFQELRPLVITMGEEDAALLAYARALSIWRARTRYCGVCSAPTAARSAGHVLRCTNASCGAEFFPRLDPAIIVLVSDGERALLGRQKEWPAGRYSTIAGFVEPGESLEDAVAREVFEETGVRVHDPVYRSSQPWPFPSSLMLGFHASAASDSPIQLDGELEDARWFTAQEVVAEGVMPTNHSISYRLIDEWLAQQSGSAML
jgi:NAD+ diphosphatase